MKQIALMILISLTVALTSCSEKNEPAHVLAGKWSMTEYTCLCPGLSLEPGEYVWEIIPEENKAIVTNNVVDSNGLTLLESGEYDIAISGTTFSIDNPSDICQYYFDESDRLVFDYGIDVDAPGLWFIQYND